MPGKICSRLGASFILISACVAVTQAVGAEADAARGFETAMNRLPTFRFDPTDSGIDFAERERSGVIGDHFAVALQVSQCYQEISDPMRWSPAARALLLFKLDDYWMRAIRAGTAVPDRAPEANLPALHPFHTAALAFSDRVSRDRLDLRQDLENNRDSSKRFEIWIVALGALATIFVSTRSMALGTTWLPHAVGFLAIACSALATAVSSFNSFAGNTAVALRDQRALSQLEQLHWRIASDVMQRPEVCGKFPPPTTVTQEAMEVVKAWRSRLETILDGATESISKPGDISNGPAAKPDDGKGPTVQQPPPDKNNSAAGDASAKKSG